MAVVGVSALAAPPVGLGAAFSWDPSLTVSGRTTEPVAVGGGKGTSDVVYAAGVTGSLDGTGEIWRLVLDGRGKARWDVVSSLEGAPMPQVTELAAAGAGTNVAYAGTLDGRHIKTRDGGKTWSVLPGATPGTSELAVSKSGRVVANPTLDAQGRSRVGVSRDGGRTWRVSAPLRIRGSDRIVVGALAVHPTRPRIMAAGVYSGGKAYTLGSTNFGRTWRAVTRAGIRATSPASGPQTWSLAFAGGSPGRLVFAPGLDRGGPRIWATASFGRTWRRSHRGIAVASAVRMRSVDVVALGGLDGPLLLSRGRRTTWSSVARTTRGIPTQHIAVGPNGWVATAGGLGFRNGVVVGRLRG
jgi:hypothetical protein